MDEFRSIKSNYFFKGITDKDIKELLDISNHVKVPKDYYLIRQGDLAESLYIILDGQVSIILQDENNSAHEISQLKSGSIIGEVAFFDEKPRSASVQTVVETRLLSVPFGALKRLAQQNPFFSGFLLRVAQNIGGQVRASNTAVSKLLQMRLAEYKLRGIVGEFMIYNLVTMCVFTFFLSWLTRLNTEVITSTFISIPTTLCFLVVFTIILKNTGLPFTSFGLTTQNWKKAVLESIGFTLLVCLFILGLKWYFIHFRPGYYGHLLFEPYLSMNLSTIPASLSKETTWLVTFIAYCICVVPIQEFIVRGGLQSPLQIFLVGKNIKLKSIIVSNILFSTCHLFMNTQVALYVFVVGVYMGWLYSRHNTLIGVIIAHAMIGTWALMIVGL